MEVIISEFDTLLLSSKIVDFSREFELLLPELRKIIDTTNVIESLNSQFRKVTKTKPIFSTDESLQKMLYLATMNVTKKWTIRYRDWDLVIGQLSIQFEGRLEGKIAE